MEIYIDEVTRSPLEELEQSYTYKETVASGAFGTVIRAIQNSNNKEVAIKILKKSVRKADTSKIKQEIAILKQLHHPNIIECFGYTETNSKLYIVMEYIANGTLRHWIDQHKGAITELEASVILEKLISAVAYLHSKDVCHRDIKPDNIMFNNRDDLTTLKLIDFGLSADSFDGFEEYDYCGTFIYMAPEQIEKKLYSKYVDLWSIGIVMFVLLNNGRHPFFVKGDYKRGYIDKIKNTKKLVMFNQISEMGQKLLKALLDPNPNLRIKAKNALCHPWVTRRMYDPIPYNFYQSMTHANIFKKMHNAMITAIFLNHFCKKKRSVKTVFIISKRYLNRIEEENINKRENHKKQREKSFEVPLKRDSFSLNLQDDINHPQLGSSHQSKLLKTKKNYFNPNISSNQDSKSTYSIISVSPSPKMSYSNKVSTMINVNSLTNRNSRKDSSSALYKHNINKISSGALNSSQGQKDGYQRDEPSSYLSSKIVLPKIMREPFINAANFPNSLRDHGNNYQSTSLSPSRNRKTQSPNKIDNEPKGYLKQKHSSKDFSIIKILKPMALHNKFNLPSQTKTNGIQRVYLPSINSASPKKKVVIV